MGIKKEVVEKYQYSNNLQMFFGYKQRLFV